MSRAPDISVVIPTYRRETRLSFALEALAEQTLDRERFEVIVVREPGQEPLTVPPSGLDVRFLAVSSPGPAKRRNEGWRAARGELVAFIDDDCEAAGDWLERGLESARANPGAIVQGLTEPNPRELDRLGPFSRTKLIDAPTPFFQTCNILYPRALLGELSGFDERFRRAGEDADLGWRALELGARRVFEPRIVVHHAVERLGPLGFLRQALRGAESAYMYKRHPGLRAEAAYAWVFWNQAQALMALSAAGLLLARRFPPAALLALPYARMLVARARAEGSVGLVPLMVAYDLLEASKAVRGSVRNRVMLL